MSWCAEPAARGSSLETEELVLALSSLPETRLRLIEITWELVNKDGTCNPDQVAFHAEELEQAIAEAEAYAKSTKELLGCLTELVLSES
jgi:hypothetical protein